MLGIVQQERAATKSRLEAVKAQREARQKAIREKDK
jgi:hypothetical protein